MADRPGIAKNKLKRTLRSAQRAWWVLLIIVAYMLLAWRFLGTSCLFASITGVPCMGCGTTRAFTSLLHGDIAGSLHYHPLLIPGIIAAFAYFAIWLFCERKPRWLEKSLIVLVVVVICVYALRMLLMFPNDEPMTFNSNAMLPRVVGLIASFAQY